MALDDILEKIRKEAEKGAAGIDARSEESAGAILKAARLEADGLRKDLLVKAEAEAARKRDNELALMRIEASKEILALRRELLGQVLDEVPAGLQGRGVEWYADFLAALPDEGMAVGDVEIQVGRDDLQRFGAEFAGVLTAALRRRSSDFRGRVLTEPGPFSRGLSQQAARVRHDLSLDALLSSLQGEMEVRVAPLLFGTP